MKVAFECLACSINQMLQESRMCNASEEQTTRLMDQVLSLVKCYRDFPNPPLIGAAIRGLAMAETGVIDPYAQDKADNMKTALALKPLVKRAIQNSDDPLLTALKASAIGNTLDSAIIKFPNLENTIETELKRPFSAEAYEAFKERIKSAKTLLMIGDNTGESVFDSLLLEALPKNIRKFYATRSIPVINDVTYQEAVDSGIAEFATILESGSKAPGTPIDQCSKEFRNLFDDADIVFSKGQGNFETLDTSERDIYFLLKAKCKVIYTLLGVEPDTYVFFNPHLAHRKGETIR